MTTLEKCVVGLGVSASAMLVFAFAIDRTDHSKAPQAAAPAAAPSHAASQAPDFAQNTAPVSAPKAAAAAEAPVVIQPLPANAPFVPDANLQQLSVIVNLATAPNVQPDKTKWQQALPAARNLLQGPCDCAQRIWLTHFVEMGEFALANSDTAYHETAKVMSTLGRNDAEAMALSQKPN